MPRALRAEAARVSAHVADGVVTLEGRVRLRSSAHRATELTRQVPGVVAVTGRIGYDHILKVAANARHP